MIRNTPPTEYDASAELAHLRAIVHDLLKGCERVIHRVPIGGDSYDIVFEAQDLELIRAAVAKAHNQSHLHNPANILQEAHTRVLDVLQEVVTTQDERDTAYQAAGDPEFRRHLVALATGAHRIAVERARTILDESKTEL